MWYVSIYVYIFFSRRVGLNRKKISIVAALLPVCDILFVMNQCEHSRCKHEFIWTDRELIRFWWLSSGIISATLTCRGKSNSGDCLIRSRFWFSSIKLWWTNQDRREGSWKILLLILWYWFHPYGLALSHVQFVSFGPNQKCNYQLCIKISLVPQKLPNKVHFQVQFRIRPSLLTNRTSA